MTSPQTAPPPDPEATPARQRQRLFLERNTYRRRRVMDAARLLPVLGAVALFVPLLWPVAAGDSSAAGRADAVPMSSAMAYVFGVWLLLICLAGVIAAGARRWFGEDTDRNKARQAGLG